VQAARRVARWAMVRDLVMWLGWLLLAAGIVALILVGVDRAVGGVAPWPWLLAGPAGAGVLGAGVLTLVRRWNVRRAAVEADTALGLKDRIASAILLGEGARGVDPVFVAMAVREGEAAGARVRARKVVPIRVNWAWGAWPVLGGCAIAVALFVPRADWSKPALAAAAEPLPAREQAARDVGAAAGVAQEALREDAEDAAVADDLAALEELQRELVDGARSTEEARTLAADHLESLAEELEQRAEVARDQAAEVRRELASAAAPEDPSALSGALRDGDLDAAREAAGQLAEQMRTLSPEERERIARDMEALAAQMDAARKAEGGAAEGEPPADEGAEPPAFEPLREQGVEPGTLEELRHETDADEAARKLEQSGVDPDAARRMADELTDQNRQREAAEEAKRKLEELSESLKEAADELRHPPPEEPEDRAPDTPKDEAADREQGSERQRDGAPKGEQGQSEQERGTGQKRESAPVQPGAESPRGAGQKERRPTDSPRDQTQGERGEQRPDAQPGNEQTGEGQRGQRDGSKESSKPGQEQGDTPGSKQGEKPKEGEKSGAKEGTSPGQPQPGQPQPDQRAPANEGRGKQPMVDPSRGGKPDAASEQRGPTPDGQQADGEQGAQPAPQPGAGDQRGPDGGREGLPGGRGGGLQDLRERLERMAHQAKDAERHERSAEQIREAAQRLMDQMTPEEREELERWAQELARERARSDGGPAATEPVDARRAPPEPARESVVGRFYGNEGIDRSGQVAGPPTPQAVEQAARSAERAIEQQNVPRSRSELIRRVFRRYSERVVPVPQEKP